MTYPMLMCGYLPIINVNRVYEHFLRVQTLQQLLVILWESLKLSIFSRRVWSVFGTFCSNFPKVMQANGMIKLHLFHPFIWSFLLGPSTKFSYSSTCMSLS